MQEQRKSASAHLFIYSDLQPEGGQLTELQRFREEVKRDIDAYDRGGPLLKHKHLDRARELGLDQAEIVRVWSEAVRRKIDRIEAAAKEAARVKRQAKRAEEEAKLRATLRRDAHREAIVENIVADYQAREGTRERPEEEPAGEWHTVERATEVELSRKAQLDNAKLFTKDMLTLTDGKSFVRNTWFYQREWWQWNGAFYEKVPEQRLTDMVCTYMDGAKVKGDESSRFRPTTRDVSALVTFLRSNVGLDDRIAPPTWLDNRGSPNPTELLAFRNCLVDVTTGKTYSHNPRLWLRDGVDFDYDPRAKCPTWEWFLKELFPTDEEAQETIEQFLGYGMTTDNQFEKAALWIGPPRSGRGTIASILERQVGPNGHSSLNIHTWRGENSRQGMVGKRVGIFHDMRLKSGQWFGDKYDPGGIDPHSQQLLLELISGDLTEIGRKLETSPSDLIQKIKNHAGDDWEFLASFRPQDKTNKKRPYRYPVRLRSGATLPDEILNIPEPTYE